MKRIYLLITDAGGGHRVPAFALKSAALANNLPWDIEIVNLYREILNRVPASVGKFLENGYITIQKKNRGWLLYLITPVLKFFIMQLLHKRLVKTLIKYWQNKKPDMVISLMPLTNGAVQESLRDYNPTIPFITIPTDFDEWSSKIWIANKGQYYICSTEKIERQILQFGVARQNIYRTSGLMVNANFYQPSSQSREVLKQQLGLDPNMPTGIVMFGAHNNELAFKILKKLRNVQNYQLIFICGHNQRLEQKLQNTKTTIKKLIVGYTKQIPYFMSLADFFIGKPGANCVSEALVSKLPVILQCDFNTMPQEKYVAQWVLQQGFGLIVKSYKQLDKEITKVIGNYLYFKQQVSTLNNQAIFEIPNILNSLLEVNRCS